MFSDPDALPPDFDPAFQEVWWSQDFDFLGAVVIDGTELCYDQDLQ